MILFYCSDIAKRRQVHNYFRDNGIFLETAALSEFEAATYKINAKGILLIGSIPPGFIVSFAPDLPIITVGKYQIGNSVHFREHTDPELLGLLKSLSEDDDCYEYNDILFAKGADVIYLGYPLRLTPAERSVLALLVKCSGRDVSAHEISEVCLGDIHLPVANVSKHISAINRKAKLIGGRKMILSPSRGYYKIGEYI